MATTTPDLLYYPSDYNLPADVPNDMQKAQTSVQAALNAHMDVAPVIGSITPPAGWAADPSGYGAPSVLRFGRLVVAIGCFVRTGAALAVTDNVAFGLGTVPTGARPLASLRTPAAWVGTTTANAANISVGLLTIANPTGDIQFTPNFGGTIKTGQWVSLAGLSWVTP